MLISPCGVRSLWLRPGLETFKKRLIRWEERAAQEGIVYTEAQLVALEQAKREQATDPEEIETHHPGYLIAQDTLYVGYLKGVGRIYQQTVIATSSSWAFAKVYDNKTPVTAADTLNDQVLPFFEEHDIPVLRVLTDRGTEYCGRDDRHPYRSVWVSMKLTTAGPRPGIPRPLAFANAFTKPVATNFIRVLFGKRFTGSLAHCRLIWMLS